MIPSVLVFYGLLLVLVILTGGPRAATAGIKLSVNSKVLRNTGTYGSPTWTAIGLTRDDQDNAPWNMTEAGAKETKAMLYAKTRIDLSRQIVVRADDSDAGYQALLAASDSQTSAIDMMFLDGPLTAEGAAGYRFHALVNQVGKPLDIDGVVYVTFECKPTWASDGYPSSVRMAASSTPSFTAL